MRALKSVGMSCMWPHGPGLSLIGPRGPTAVPVWSGLHEHPAAPADARVTWDRPTRRPFSVLGESAVGTDRVDKVVAGSALRSRGPCLSECRTVPWPAITISRASVVSGRTRMKVPCINPRHSLLNETRRELKRMQTGHSPDRARIAPDRAWQLVAKPVTAIAFAGLVSLLVVLMLVLGPQDETERGGYVQAVWGVQAALLGFAVAVAVFGLQLGRDAWRGRAVAIAPRLESSIVLGLALLVVTGAVAILPLNGGSEQAVSVVLLGATTAWFVVLAAGFAEVKRLTGLQTHLEVRRSRVIHATVRAARRTFETRVGARLLKDIVRPRSSELAVPDAIWESRTRHPLRRHRDSRRYPLVFTAAQHSGNPRPRNGRAQFSPVAKGQYKGPLRRRRPLCDRQAA